MYIFYEPGIPQGVNLLNEDESRHATKVLRLKPGDRFKATDGQGRFYTCRIKSVGKNCAFEALQTLQVPPPSHHIHVALAPTKNQDRIEWFVEKAVEIGVQEITLMICERSERSRIRMERLCKKALAAMKQSQQAWMPRINEPMQLIDLISDAGAQEKFIACLTTEHPLLLRDAAAAGRSSLTLIGPEGDFTQREIDLAMEKGFKPVSLGPNRLRTETAALVACHTLALLNY